MHVRIIDKTLWKIRSPLIIEAHRRLPTLYFMGIVHQIGVRPMFMDPAPWVPPIIKYLAPQHVSSDTPCMFITLGF